MLLAVSSSCEKNGGVGSRLAKAKDQPADRISQLQKASADCSLLPAGSSWSSGWLSAGIGSPVGGTGLGSPVEVTVTTGTTSDVGSSGGGSTTSTRVGDLPVGGDRGSSLTTDLGGTALLGRGESLGLESLALDLFGVAVEEHVDHDVPVAGSTADGASEAEDLTGEEPPDETDGVLGLVVGRDGDVDELEWGVGVAEGDDGDVDVRGLTDGLVVDAWVGDDDEAWLLEGSGDVVGEGSWGESSGDGLGAGVGGELEDGTVTVGSGRDDRDVGWGVCDGRRKIARGGDD